MSRTYRRSRMYEKWGNCWYTESLKVSDGLFREGIEQYHSKSCNPKKGCNYCKSNRAHSTIKRYLNSLDYEETLHLVNKRNPLRSRYV